MNRTAMSRLIEAGSRAPAWTIGDCEPRRPDGRRQPARQPEDEITWRVDVSAYLPQKRAALEAHRSQATDIERFLSMPPEVFATILRLGALIEPGDDGPMRRGWPFGDV